MVDFGNCVIELENWKEGKAVILCADGENFCSGGDLDFATAIGTPENGFKMSYFMQDVLKRYRNLKLVFIIFSHKYILLIQILNIHLFISIQDKL